ncbi:MAG: class I SAM-dependent methyltransferase [Promethearchaeota archaeon]
MEEYKRALNKKNQIIMDYNSSAQFYDSRYKQIQEEKYSLVLNRYKINGKMILDLGSGTGLLFEFINSLKTKYQNTLKYMYVAVDISWNMLLKHKIKALKSNREKNINLILADAENLPFRENTFNCVFSFTLFQNLPHIKKGIQELLRVSIQNCDLKFSILKKETKLQNLLELLKPLVKDLEIIDKEHIEDIIIQGKIKTALN